MKQKRRAQKLKGILSILLVFVMVFGAIPYYGGSTADAKTKSSVAAENVFFYVTNSDGKDVLMKVLPIDELISLSHGQTTGTDTDTNYYFSATDNLPATTYAEAKGFTLPELVDYVKANCSAVSSPPITYSGNDKMCFMATDSYGTYNRDWTYDQLYGIDRYYFPGIYDATKGWKPGWEISDGTYGPTNSEPIPLDIYNSQYQGSDSYYSNKRAAFESGTTTTAILATVLETGRTDTEIKAEVTDNSGVVTGCLKDKMTTAGALTLCIPQTEAVLMSGNRTAYHNFKWIYNIKLQMATAPEIPSLGTVAEPTADVTVSPDGNTMYLTMNCATEGASIYYSIEDEIAQTLYPGSAVAFDVTGRDLAEDPVYFYMRAVKEGYDDEGIVSSTYLAKAPVFETLYNGTVGNDVTFSATDAVTESEWNDWSSKISDVRINPPSSSTPSALTAGTDYTVDDTAKTITFAGSLFTAGGAYSFLIYSDGYANKALSVTQRKMAPAIVTESKYYIGSDMTLSFDDTAYQSGTTVQVARHGSSQTPATISSGYLDKGIAGRLTIKSNYFSSAGCAIDEAGTYTLTLTNSSYTPSSQTVDIIVAPASEKPVGNSFTYVLSSGASGGTVGDTVTVNVRLNSNQDSYLLYGGGYRVVLDRSYLELTSTSASGIWTCGSKNKNDGNTALTFGTLDRTGNGITANASMDMGSFTVKLLKAGTASIQSSDAMLTDSAGAARENVSGNNLSLAITAAATDPGTPVNPVTPVNPGGSIGGGGAGAPAAAPKEEGSSLVKGSDGVKRAVAETNTSATTDTSGKAKASISSSTLGSALDQAAKSAQEADIKAGNKAGTTGIEVKVEVKAAANAKAVETALPGDILKEMAQKTNAQLTVNTPVADISLDQKALAAIAAEAGSEVTLSAEKVDISSLSEETRKEIGDAPVFDLKVMGKNGAVSSFNGGTATVSVPYQLKEGESASQVTVYYLDSTGKMTKMNCVYDAATKTATFETTHFSYYAVVIENGAARFRDISKSAWYYEAVNYAVKNGLFNGTGETTFSPSAGMTRAMFVTVLGRAGEVNTANYAASSFSDVKSGSWYGSYVQWAYENKIVSGVGDGRFAPDQAITREEMASILTHYNKWKNKDAAASETALTYSDTGKIAGWAAEGVKLCAEKAWLTGYPDGSFQPQKTATRAEVANVLYKVVQ